jgi:hypothetical protein
MKKNVKRLPHGNVQALLFGLAMIFFIIGIILKRESATNGAFYVVSSWCVLRIIDEMIVAYKTLFHNDDDDDDMTPKDALEVK